MLRYCIIVYIAIHDLTIYLIWQDQYFDIYMDIDFSEWIHGVVGSGTSLVGERMWVRVPQWAIVIHFVVVALANTYKINREIHLDFTMF